MATEIVQGKAASAEEHRVAVALDKLHWPYEFQVGFFGGKSLRGGTVVDFLVFTIPSTPLYVDGEHWHKNAQSEKDNLVRKLLVASSHGSLREIVVIYGSEVKTQEDADAIVLKYFGRYN